MAARAPDDFDRTLVSIGEGESLSGRYRLLRELGRGGMGVVWLAEDSSLDDRKVALKLLPTVLGGDRRAVARLKKEAILALELTHPHIVRLYTFEQDAARGDLAYIVMQYVDGRTLNDLLADHPEGLPLDRVLKWADGLASALDHAHASGVLHRDIKPSNVIIDGGDRAYLMDFGIAREMRDTVTRLTGRDSSGTLPYMSLQQVLGKNHPSNDVYSLAATIYEALGGEPPFSTGDIVEQIRHVMPEPLEAQPSDVNAGLLAGLAKTPEGRPGSAHALVSALRGGGNVVRVAAQRDTDGSLASRYVDPRTGISFLLVRAGSFRMGGAEHADEMPVHEVKITRSFYLAETGTTVSQWRRFAADGSYDHDPGGASGDHPQAEVSWEDAQAFCKQYGYRLPTEAEWEYACRAGTTGDRYGELDRIAWHGGNSGNGAHRVGEKEANAWGFKDMLGNLWEWCEDAYDTEYYKRSPRENPVNREGSDRVLRGGSWYGAPDCCRAPCRSGGDPSNRGVFLGFRVARTP